MPAAVHPLPGNGRPIGRYEPIRRLAVGGMAEIYLARMPGLGIEGFEKLVVLKRILPQHALDPELLRMFLDEARLSATLTHPHVTEVYDVGADGDAPFFAMEYVHGANLRELLRAHARAVGTAPAPLELAHAIGIVGAAAAGLHYAHERLGPGGEPLGIVHRDVSPSNVLVSYDGAVKVSDFGIAKWALQRTQTQEGTLKGKFAYMSPEQCRGRGVDRRSDVFALGTILYELTTGAAPFSGDSDLEILNRIATGVAAPPAWPDDKGSYPPALAAITMRALHPEPDQRFPTMQAFQVALEGFAREASLPVSTVALGGLMQRLFAEELAAWREAQRAGKSLGEHLAARQVSVPSGDPGERTATDAFGPTRRRASARGRWGRALGLAAFAAVFALAGGLAAKAWVARAQHEPTGASAAPAVSPAAHARSVAPPIPPAAPPTAPTKIVSAPVTPVPAEPATTRTHRAAKRPRPEAPPPPAPVSRLRTWDPDSPKPP
ncbi:MAG TPA: serine/threonine-protein kinase [Polyangia bacterium]|jgi:tRNA A-37 threonylcarbamoyl transferase component Bud32